MPASWWAARLAGRHVLALSGRVHAYEGHDMRDGHLRDARHRPARRPARDPDQRRRRHFAQLLARRVDGDRRSHQPDGAESAGGAQRRALRPALSRHDATSIRRRLRALADETARAQGLPIQHGVYIAVLGPSYETPAEIRAFRTLGADAVGMSTAPEAIVARHMGIEVLGISCITNPAAGVFPEPLHHDEVMETARAGEGAVHRAAGGDHWAALSTSSPPHAPCASAPSPTTRASRSAPRSKPPTARSSPAATSRTPPTA